MKEENDEYPSLWQREVGRDFNNAIFQLCYIRQADVHVQRQLTYSPVMISFANNTH